MPMLRKLATLATVAEFARRYAKNNPEQAGKILDQAAAFVDKQTSGKYRAQIDSAARRAKGVAGIHHTAGHSISGNGYSRARAGYQPYAPK